MVARPRLPGAYSASRSASWQRGILGQVQHRAIVEEAAPLRIQPAQIQHIRRCGGWLRRRCGSARAARSGWSGPCRTASHPASHSAALPPSHSFFSHSTTRCPRAASVHAAARPAQSAADNAKRQRRGNLREYAMRCPLRPTPSIRAALPLRPAPPTATLSLATHPANPDPRPAGGW